MDDSFSELRRREFSRLDDDGHVYVDYTGAALYPESLVRGHAEMLAKGVFGNPHSRSPASRAATRLVERTRERVARFFRADPGEYDVVFTPNSTGGLKLVGESYAFETGSRLLLSADNHNSMLGIREYARARGAEVAYVPLDGELRCPDLERCLVGADPRRPNLFAFPAQSNFSGAIHPLQGIEAAHAAGYDVVLDAAAFVPTSRLDLTRHKPDFVCVSFYKMFGFPTGVGALMVRHRVRDRLRRPWFAGGTVRFSSVQNPVHILYRNAEAFEDGTLNYLGIAAVHDGLDFLDSIGMEEIGRHVAGHGSRLLEAMQGLQHASGGPMVRIYGPRDMTARGGTFAFNLLDPEGRIVDCRAVEQAAEASRISLRTGRFCNPGAAELAFEYPESEAVECFRELEGDTFTLTDFSLCLAGRPVGAVRVSLGVATDLRDVDRVIELLAGFRDRPAEPLPAGIARTLVPGA